MSKKKIIIEDGFQIIMLFLRGFWWKFLRKVMINKRLINQKELTVEERNSVSNEKRIKDILHNDNNFFFLVVCDGTSDDYFEKVLEERMNIPPMKQHDGLIVTEELLFQLAIDFCEYFNRRYQEEGKDSLRFAIDWLIDMQKYPKAHKVEWDIWDQVVIDVIEHKRKSLRFF